MKIDRVLELLKIERECVTRQSPCNEKSKLCDRNCGECDIAQNDLELIEMYDFVISMIETLIGRSQWISVKDDLPKEHDSIFANHTHLSKHMWAKESDNVIVYVRFPDGTGRSTEGRLQDGKWWTRVSPMLEPVVTHWMPFPESPKGEDEHEKIENKN